MTTSRRLVQLCAHFITHLFACPEYPPSSSNSPSKAASLHHIQINHGNIHGESWLLFGYSAYLTTICSDCFYLALQGSHMLPLQDNHVLGPRELGVQSLMRLYIDGAVQVVRGARE